MGNLRNKRLRLEGLLLSTLFVPSDPKKSKTRFILRRCISPRGGGGGGVKDIQSELAAISAVLPIVLQVEPSA